MDFLFQTTYCLIASFYIKPQLSRRPSPSPPDCLISSFYIKPQPWTSCGSSHSDCLISSFYIKPQLWTGTDRTDTIVLYRLSTSNHNLLFVFSSFLLLSYIVFLHQTTTVAVSLSTCCNCLISSFYIKPQRRGERSGRAIDCLISSFYIKPQLLMR